MSRLFLLFCLLLSVAACAPTVQVAGAPPLGFAGPRLLESGAAPALVSFDGTRLPMSLYPAVDPAGRAVEPWAVVVGLHGMNDYGGQAFDAAGPAWAKVGVTTYAYDQRGFGRGPNRGIWGGERLMTEDLRTAVTLVRAAHPRAVIAVVGESMGGAVAIAAFASDRPPTADRLVLVSPAVWGWSEQAPLNAAALWIAAHMQPGRRLVTPAWIARKYRASDNTEMLRRLGRDRNMIFATRADAIYGLMNIMQAAQDRIGRVRAPLLYLYGRHDQLIPQPAAFHAAARIKPTDRSAWYPAGYHMLTRDLQGEVVWRDVASFLRDPSAPLPSGAPSIPTAPATGALAAASDLAPSPGPH